MMEAKDTQLTEKQINKIALGLKNLGEWDYNQRIVLCNAIRTVQAEISFKAGKQEGTREVVKWLGEPCNEHTDPALFREVQGWLGDRLMRLSCAACWQALHQSLEEGNDNTRRSS